jgi:TrpR-related protein YerC/YecD
MSNLRADALTRLFEVLLKLRTVDECYAFFEDLCTVRELKDLSQRLEVAFLLHEGLSYQEVTKRTGVSATTISRVNRCLEYGSGGYRLAIERTEAEP